MKFGVNEVFESVQGEAALTGSPSVFLRLQGCSVGCPWCDTKHTWDVDDSNQISSVEMMAKSVDSPKFAMMSADDICHMLADMRSRHVVITGGEPCAWDLHDLCCSVFETGKSVQIETSGTFEVNVPSDVWVTVSPKIGMPGGWKVLRQAVDRANEIKMPIGKAADIDKLLEFVSEYGVKCPVWLQPLSQNSRATDLCIQGARLHGWRISVQTHKFLGVR